MARLHYRLRSISHDRQLSENKKMNIMTTIVAELSLQHYNCVPFPYDFLDDIFNFLADITTGLSYIICTKYIICVNRMFTSLITLPVNSRLVVLEFPESLICMWIFDRAEACMTNPSWINQLAVNSTFLQFPSEIKYYLTLRFHDFGGPGITTVVYIVLRNKICEQQISQDFSNAVLSVK